MAAALALIGIIYLVDRFHRFYFLEQLSKKQKRLSWLLAALLVTGILSSGLVFNWYTMALIIIHLVLIWLFCDLVGWIIRKYRKKERTFNYSGGAALLLTLMLLTGG
ncbi:MAG: metallophosphoesterase, partial [Oscillospiraceae bacterium]|nr:metallophosphoesterase [Oscillospiraceae bacterium]